LSETQKEIKYIDLFCGLGAFHYAFNSLQTKSEKYKCVFACDIDENVRKIYAENYGLTPEGDINNVNPEKIPDFDILCGGFPCQPFSIAGKKEGFEDKVKGNLFYAILKIIDAKNPSTVILENVKNLLTINGGETFNIIIAELEKRGYVVAHKIIDSKYYGSPQSRQRLFIVGSPMKQPSVVSTLLRFENPFHFVMSYAHSSNRNCPEDVSNKNIIYNLL
jgi:DNA (cytosine-5)-methyltransferase 1